MHVRLSTCTGSEESVFVGKIFLGLKFVLFEFTFMFIIVISSAFKHFPIISN